MILLVWYVCTLLGLDSGSTYGHVSAERHPAATPLAWEREFDKVSFEGSKIENKTQTHP